jgi:hypothetical protein
LNLSNSERDAKDVKSSKERESKDRKVLLIASCYHKQWELPEWVGERREDWCGYL